MSSLRTARRTLLVLLGAVGLVGAGLLAGDLLDVRTASAAAAPGAGPVVRCLDDRADSDRIQAAIDGSARGDEIVVLGRCAISRTVVLRGERSYRGTGPGTVLRAVPGSNLEAVLASDSWAADASYTGTPVMLSRMTVDGAKGVNPSAGDGVVLRSWGSTVQDLTIKDARRDGLRITTVSRHGTALVNTQVNGVVRSVFVTGSGRHGIEVQDPGNAVTDWNLADCWVVDSGGDAVRLANSAGWMVERNHLYGVGGTAIRAERAFGTGITGNYVEDFGTAGIALTVQGDAASTVTGNRVFQLAGTGTTFLLVEQVNYGSGQLAVTGNVVRGAGTGTGMAFRGGGHPLRVTSAGNSVEAVGTPRTLDPATTLAPAW